MELRETACIESQKHDESHLFLWPFEMTVSMRLVAQVDAKQLLGIDLELRQDVCIFTLFSSVL